MINYDTVIQQLRTYAGGTLKSVGGAATVEAIPNQVNQTLPAAIVVPLGFSAEKNTSLAGALRQIATETFGVVVIADAGDVRGQAGASLMPNIRTAIWKAILNFRVDTEYAPQGIYLVDDGFLSYDTGRVMWQFTFALDVQIGAQDGFIPFYEDLTEISVTTPTYGEILDITGLNTENPP